MPTVFPVTHLRDDLSAGSLRSAIAEANAVPFAPDLAGTLRLTGEVTLTTDVTLDGPASRRVTLDGRGLNRHFTVSGGATVFIDDLTLANGRATGTPIDLGLGDLVLRAGGSILNTGSTLNLTRVTLADNEVDGGPAFAAGGAVANIRGRT